MTVHKAFVPRHMYGCCQTTFLASMEFMRTDFISNLLKPMNVCQKSLPFKPNSSFRNLRFFKFNGYTSSLEHSTLITYHTVYLTLFEVTTKALYYKTSQGNCQMVVVIIMSRNYFNGLLVDMQFKVRDHLIRVKLNN